MSRFFSSLPGTSQNQNQYLCKSLKHDPATVLTFLSPYFLFCDFEMLACLYWLEKSWICVLPVKARSKPTRRCLQFILDGKVISFSLCSWNCLQSVEQHSHLQDTHVSVTSAPKGHLAA